MPAELDQAIRELNWAMYRLGFLETAIKGLKWPPTRRALMSLKDDIKADIATAMNKVRAAKDVDTGLRTTIQTLQDQNKAISDQIATLQAQSGAWTDADLQEIKDGVDALSTALDPDAVAAAVNANTPAAAPAA